jgi:hypothetical protein
MAPGAPKLARIAIDGHWRGDIDLARNLLRDICTKWPTEQRVLSLSTCGAFLTVNFPPGVTEQASNWFPTREAISEIDKATRPSCQALLDGGLWKELGRRADFLTIGVDTAKAKISRTGNRINDQHAELVYVANLKTGTLHLTGKSYPTTDQEGGLLRIADLESHFVDMNGVMAMVLGCHDLNIFSRRSDGTAKRFERVAVKKKFKELYEKRQPRVVLHHPHTTIKVGTWRDAWGGLKASGNRSAPSHLGTGCYSHKDDWPNRNPLSAVLESTKSHDVLDIIVHLAGCPSK